MIELYAYPYTYAMGCHILLEESGVDYSVTDVSQFSHLPEPDKQRAESAFTEASPHRRVPALRLGSGRSMCESGAIALYLADSLGDNAFTVTASSPDRPDYLQWLFYLSSTLQPEVMLQFHPEYYFEDTTRQQQLQQASMNRLDKIWQVIEDRYQSGPWMFDNRPTAVDFSLATVLMWPECFRNQLSDYPNLNKVLDAVKHRDSTSHVIDWHQRKTSSTGRPRENVSGVTG